MLLLKIFNNVLQICSLSDFGNILSVNVMVTKPQILADYHSLILYQAVAFKLY
jgi:hypothetical protein